MVGGGANSGSTQTTGGSAVTILTNLTDTNGSVTFGNVFIEERTDGVYKNDNINLFSFTPTGGSSLLNCIKVSTTNLKDPLYANYATFNAVGNIWHFVNGSYPVLVNKTHILA